MGMKVTGSDNPLVKAVLEIQEAYPGILPTRLRGRMLGDVYVDEVYIYHLPLPTAKP